MADGGHVQDVRSLKLELSPISNNLENVGTGKGWERWAGNVWYQNATPAISSFPALAKVPRRGLSDAMYGRRSRPFAAGHVLGRNSTRLAGTQQRQAA
jgi:hypothetical protein